MKTFTRILGTIVLAYVVLSIGASALVSCGIGRWEIIGHRSGLTIIDFTVGEVKGWDTPYEQMYGRDQHGGYIGYRHTEGVKAGDKVLSVFLYNPLTNWTDDILERWDVAVWE